MHFTNRWLLACNIDFFQNNSVLIASATPKKIVQVLNICQRKFQLNIVSFIFVVVCLIAARKRYYCGSCHSEWPTVSTVTDLHKCNNLFKSGSSNLTATYEEIV